MRCVAADLQPTMELMVWTFLVWMLAAQIALFDYKMVTVGVQHTSWVVAGLPRLHRAIRPSSYWACVKDHATTIQASQWAAQLLQLAWLQLASTCRKTQIADTLQASTQVRPCSKLLHDSMCVQMALATHLPPSPLSFRPATPCSCVGAPACLGAPGRGPVCPDPGRRPCFQVLRHPCAP
jgi:hypothetical protein